MANPSTRHAMRHKAEQLAARLPPLLVAAERVASTVAQGVHGRRRVGQGDSFWQFRRYESTDAATMIDWRQSAKTQSLYVRETEWEAAQTVWLWRDASPSMRYRSARSLPEKAERVDLLLLALASLLVRGGEHMALLGEDMRPASGRAALEKIAAAVTRFETPAPGNDRRAGSLPPFQLLPRHAQLVLLGDFLSPIEEFESLVRRFAARGVRGHVLQVLDPAEETLPFGGRTRFEGFESEGEVLIRRVEHARGDYLSKLAAHQDALATVVRRIGWQFDRHRTDRSPESALLALYMGLSGMRGGRR
ncbi:MAG TPA: DUF58 domain-containing protein [Alphaproteobacteria bacterium]